MTRDQALEVSNLVFKIESLENLIDELKHLCALEDYYGYFGDSTLQDELITVVQAKLNIALKELEEL